MGFKYIREKEKFDREWQQLREKYVDAGMGIDAIQSLYEFDWAWFNSRRQYSSHTQPFPAPLITEDNSENSVLYRKYSSLSIEMEEVNSENIFSWIDTIENKTLISKLSSLSVEDKKCLSLYVIYGFTQLEIAKIFGVSQAAISQRIHRIAKLLK